MDHGRLRRIANEDSSVVGVWLRTYLEQHRAWWQEAYGHPPVTPLDELVERDWSELCNANDSATGFVRVLQRAGPVGIIRVETRTEPFMGFPIGVLSWVFVDEAARGTGVAKTLLQAAEAWLDAQGVRGRKVYVTAVNESAVRLYQRHGYRIVDYRMLK